MMLALVNCFSAVAGLAQAQASTADLVGTVVDPNGAVVAGATVTARNPATGIYANRDGERFGRVSDHRSAAGRIRNDGEAATFKKAVISPVTLNGRTSALELASQTRSRRRIVDR